MISSSAVSARKVHFERRELDLILRLYGRMVAGGHWRDYAIDALAERAMFSVFRRSSEAPLYVIEKRPMLALRQGAYAVATGQGFIIKRGRDLATVLNVFDRTRFGVVTD
jgi:hypothetical protein